MENFMIYPAIDLRDGNVVRLRQGKLEEQTQYSNSPTEVARQWMREGAKWIHIVNLDGAFGKPSAKNLLAIQSIINTAENKVNLQLGGGIRTVEDISHALSMGISRVVLGTSVIENPEYGEQVLNEFGGERIAFGFDALGEELMSRGWQSKSGINMLPLANRLAKAGAKTIIYTNIQKDGMQTGVDWQTAKNLSDQTGLDIIASGGTTSLDDINAVRKAGLAGVIVGRAVYEGNFSLKEALDVC